MAAVSAKDQIEQLRTQLIEAHFNKEQAEAQVKASQETINAIRSALAGVSIGQQLERQSNQKDASVEANSPQGQEKVT